MSVQQLNKDFVLRKVCGVNVVLPTGLQCHYCPMHHQKVAAKQLCDPDYCNYVKARFKVAEKTK